MADIKRRAKAVWYGDLPSGNGRIETGSGAIKDEPYSFGTRFKDKPGTNPEELIAAAHAACFSMAFSNTLAENGYQPESIRTGAVCFLSKTDEGFRITRMELTVEGNIPGIDKEEFGKMVRLADEGCPVSNLLREGLEIELEAELA